MKIHAPLLVLSLMGFAIQAQASLQGVVTLANQAPKQGVTLTLQSTGESSITDAKGAFLFATASTSILTNVNSTQPIRMAQGMVVMQLASRTQVSVQIFNLAGKLVGQSPKRWMEAGEFQANPFQGMNQTGLYVVRINTGSLQQSLLVQWMGSPSNSSVRITQGATVSSTQGTTASLKRVAGAVDAITVKIGGDSVGEVSTFISQGTLPNIVVVQRTVKGAITLNGNTVSSILIDLKGNAGELVSLDPTWAAGTAQYQVVAPWRVVNSATQWIAHVNIGLANGSAISDSSKTFVDSASVVQIPTIVLKSSSSTVSSSSVKASSSSIKVSSSSVVASSASALYIAPLDSAATYAVNWVWTNRILDPTEVNALGGYNFLEDKIMGEKGTLNVCVRWESTTKVTQTQRDKFEPMLNRAVNNWTKWLRGYDGFPYDTVKVKIIGWAVIDSSYLDMTGITVPVYKNGSLTLVNGNWVTGATAPYCPTDCARETYYNGSKVTTTYPNCKAPNQHFVTVLWGTDGFVGGAGTEGGARVASDYILSVLDLQEPHIIEHEFGHGFSFPDFYTDATDCPGGNCANLPLSIMNAGASMVITDWDKVSLRNVWDKMNAQTPSRW